MAALERPILPSHLLASLLNRLTLPDTPIPKEISMSKSRRNLLIRTVATVSGDIATGIALASVAFWFIESAALGLFLSFLVWLLAALAALALSQYVVHPALSAALSDRKLDVAIDAASAATKQLSQFARLAMAGARTAFRPA